MCECVCVCVCVSSLIQVQLQGQWDAQSRSEPPNLFPTTMSNAGRWQALQAGHAAVAAVAHLLTAGGT